MNSRYLTACHLWILASLLLALGSQPLFGLSLEELRKSRRLTPQRFAGYFADFSYLRHDEVQAPEHFLSTRAGDCDDYATLAAQILSEKGYTTRLIAVRLPGEVHVVCYVAETKSYLDYNNRRFLVRTVASDGTLTDVANKVAKSFSRHWTSASEFTCRDGLKRLVTTVLSRNPAKVQLATLSRPKLSLEN